MTEGEISLYTDDHQIFALGSSTSIVEGKLLSEGNKITKWYKENLLQLNVQKNQSMLLGSRTEANNIKKHRTIEIYQIVSQVYTWTLNLILVSILVLFTKTLANR